MGFRRILVVIAMMIATLPVAQAAFQVGVLGGLAVTGASLSTGLSTNTLQSSSKASFKIGFSGEYDVMPNLISVEMNLLYSKYQWEQSTTGITLASEVSTSWWELPIFVNYTGIEWFKFGLGPVFDFATGSVHTENPDGTSPVDRSYSAAGLGSTSVGIGFQAGFTYPVSAPWTINADMRYVLGLTNLSQVSPASTNLHSFDFLVGVGYAL